MPTEPQDIFQEVEPAADAQPVRRAVSVAPGIPSVVPAPEIRGVQPRRSRLPLLAGGTVVLLVGIAAAVFFLRRSPESATNTGTSNSNGAVSSTAATNTQTAPGGVAVDVIVNDKDRDGLSDEEEQKLGTKDAVPDTDGDGLSDDDEVTVYKTNPLKPDTDGDGNADGAEVKKGYNPNGAGLLLNFEAARQKLTK